MYYSPSAGTWVCIGRYVGWEGICLVGWHFREGRGEDGVGRWEELRNKFDIHGKSEVVRVHSH